MSQPVIEEARAAGQRALTEPEAKAVLEAAGIPVPEHRVVVRPSAAVEAADEIGYPVVAKVVSRDVHHKTEWADGAGVALGLGDSDAVREATGRIVDSLDTTGTEGSVLVEAAVDVDRGTELLLGGSRHRSFGPVVTLGLGGIYTEVFEDVAHRLAPFDDAEAEELLGEFDGAKLLDGVRGQPPADRAAVRDAARALGSLIESEPAVSEVDINPLLATADGVLALDALVLLDAGE